MAGGAGGRPCAENGRRLGRAVAVDSPPHDY